jgi:Flp pilus assembly protein TadD/CheY-like chemotaxis protein
MKKLSCLLVDDNPVAIRELGDNLKYIGHKDVHNSADGNDAWSILQIKEFDCVFSAWDMPDMSGLALLRIVRRDDRFFNLPFFLTSDAFTKVKVIQAGEAGVTGLIVKPYSPDIIKTKIKELSETIEGPPPTKDEIKLEKALETLENKEYGTALEMLERLLEEGESAEVYYNIGYIKTTQERYEEALKAFRKATQIDRLFAKAYEAMGRVYKDMGRTEEAEKCLQKAADIYMDKEKTDNAEEILNEILQIGGDSINVYNSLGVLSRKRGDFEKALKHYNQALKVHPKEPYIYYNIGRLYMEMKDTKNAKAYFIKALEHDQDFQEAKDILSAIELGSI